MTDRYTQSWWLERLPFIRAYAEGRGVSVHGRKAAGPLRFCAPVEAYQIEEAVDWAVSRQGTTTS